MKREQSESTNRAQEPLASLTPPFLKRMISFSILVILGMILVFLAFAYPPESLIWQGFLFGFGAAVLFLAENLRRSTRLSLILWADRLEDSTGRQICRLEDIKSIDRGAFAFKPSNGFLIRTRTRLPGRWAPGLWWQLGYRIGVGGVTPAGQAKFMAELLSLHVLDDKDR